MGLRADTVLEAYTDLLSGIPLIINPRSGWNAVYSQCERLLDRCSGKPQQRLSMEYADYDFRLAEF